MRAACALLVVALTTFLARNTLLDVFDPVRLGRSDADDAIRSALVAIAISAAAVFVVWTIVAVVDGRLELSARALRLANTAGLVVVAVGLVVGVLALALRSRPRAVPRQLG